MYVSCSCIVTSAAHILWAPSAADCTCFALLELFCGLTQSASGCPSAQPLPAPLPQKRNRGALQVPSVLSAPSLSPLPALCCHVLLLFHYNSGSVIEDCGALLSCAITAASLALIDAGIDCKVRLRLLLPAATPLNSSESRGL